MRLILQKEERDIKLYCALRGNRGGSEAVYSLLEYAYRNEYGGALPEIKKTPNGKPFFPTEPQIHFSLSHARVFVLCAVSDRPVGVDIESPRNISAGAVAYFCSREERVLFDPLELWVLKESYIKLTDLTLPAIKHLRFSREGSRIVAPSDNAMVKIFRFSEYANGKADSITKGSVAAVSTFGGAIPDRIEFVQNT